MKYSKHFFILLGLSVFLSCTPTSSDSSLDTSSQTDAEISTPSPSIENGTWEDFWSKFQIAVTNDDTETLASLTHFGDRMRQKGFKGEISDFLTAELKEVIANSKATDITLSEYPEEGYPEYREIYWSETIIMEGVEYGSGLFLYFAKMDGQYKLVGLLAAG
jgi:hypothetical protein